MFWAIRKVRHRHTQSSLLSTHVKASVFYNRTNSICTNKLQRPEFMRAKSVSTNAVMSVSSRLVPPGAVVQVARGEAPVVHASHPGRGGPAATHGIQDALSLPALHRLLAMDGAGGRGDGDASAALDGHVGGPPLRHIHRARQRQQARGGNLNLSISQFF